MNVIVTGSNGLIGSAVVRLLCKEKHQVWGLDNGGRVEFFGPDANNEWVGAELSKENALFTRLKIDITNQTKVFDVISKIKPDAVVHCAAQPSHDWAASDPLRDYAVNCTGTLFLLEAVRLNCPTAKFIFMSTNKVYGDGPNHILLEEGKTRFSPPRREVFRTGFNETFPVDQCKHSLFGCSKLSADLYVQEYGRYFGLKTVVLRGGCLTGPQHGGVALHGFLSYLFKCALLNMPYTIIGYGGKQVRDNIHSYDVATAIKALLDGEYLSGDVYNLGGEEERSCSVLEAIAQADQMTGTRMLTSHESTPRGGDHKWYVTDMAKFKADFPNWNHKYSLQKIYEDMFDHSVRSVTSE